jgi:hypothetical protein
VRILPILFSATFFISGLLPADEISDLKATNKTLKLEIEKLKLQVEVLNLKLEKASGSSNSDADTSDTSCYLYLYFNARSSELAGNHTLRLGDSIYSFNLPDGRQVLKFQTGCTDGDLFIDSSPVVPVHFNQGRECLTIVKKRSRDTASGFENGYSSKDASSLWDKGKFLEAKDVGLATPNP